MVRACSECGGDLTDLDPTAEMGSTGERYECRECARWGSCPTRRGCLPRSTRRSPRSRHRSRSACGRPLPSFADFMTRGRSCCAHPEESRPIGNRSGMCRCALGFVSHPGRKCRAGPDLLRVAGLGGVIDPTSLRIDNQPTCASGKTLQQWTQHGDTSDIVGLTGGGYQVAGPIRDSAGNRGSRWREDRVGRRRGGGDHDEVRLLRPLQSGRGLQCARRAGHDSYLQAPAPDTPALTAARFSQPNVFVGWSGTCEGQGPECADHGQHGDPRRRIVRCGDLVRVDDP